jgi:hypothetical protein
MPIAWLSIASLALCLLAGSERASACSLYWNLPPWRGGKQDPAAEQRIAEEEAKAEATFSRLTDGGNASLEEFERNLDALMEKIRAGTGAFASSQGRRPEETLVEFISYPIVMGSEADIIPYLVRKGRLDLALFYVQWLPRQLGFENLLGVYPIGAHAHNDYEHRAPLFNAMLLGFDSIEADIYVVRKDDIKKGGNYERYLREAGILEGRDDFFVLRHAPTWSYVKSAFLGFDFDVDEPSDFPEFEDYYLRPLREFARRYPKIAEIRRPSPLRILVDFKRAAYAMFDPFMELAERYKEILTWFEWDPEAGEYIRHEGFVQIVISGFDGPVEFRPTRRILDRVCKDRSDRFVLLDGRMDDGQLHERFEACGIDFDLDFTPLISTSWNGVRESEIEDALAKDPRFDSDGRIRSTEPADGEEMRAKKAATIGELSLELNPDDIRKSHSIDPARPIRIYGAPTLGCGTLPQGRAFREIAWEIQYQACVDIINADDLRGLYWFLMKKKIQERENPGSTRDCS